METVRFKTNAKCGGCVSKIGAELNELMRYDQWSLDLDSPDKVLTVTSNLSDDKIIRAVTAAGFKAERIK